MKCSKHGIGCVGNIKSGQLRAFHCFSEEPRQQFVQPPIPRRLLKCNVPGEVRFVARLISPFCSSRSPGAAGKLSWRVVLGAVLIVLGVFLLTEWR